ncbi:beta strand repeat-containing protein [Trinickia acidisoli]|uniref:beta strand repeat-containing protein n=1 Tax=Trinickia acidisoli TaxID=2767482 RepID=UPI001F5C22E2|nr:filamentous hemagglutinin N-terminal domain-containing protein [Trinickia acidisoli]
MTRMSDVNSQVVGPTLMASAIRSAMAMLFGISALANAGTLPSGGRFVAGGGSITGNGTSLTINQTSGSGVIDWTRFSIDSGNRVVFDNGNGATLNRVTGGATSFILGKLSATGSVYLINPQGIVIGANGVVSTGGRFVASTLDVENAAFMSGGALTFSGSSTRRVVNLGKIGSTNGDVFLISADEIDNFGSVKAPNGSAELATGKTVLLQDSSTGQQVFVQAGSRGTIVNLGAIDAAQVSLQAADGNIFALAGNDAAIRATGTATRDGHVWLVADTGGITLAQPIEAHNADGSGGAVDTNAAGFAFVGCMPSVLAGVWNITTPSIAIDAPAASIFSRSLSAGTAINLQTTGASGTSGDVDVAANIGWTGDASLTLGAYHTVTIGTGVMIANQGGGNLTLRADAPAIDNGGGVIDNGTLDWSKSTGIATLLYDMNGTYSPGTLLGNASWASPMYSGLVTQITAYQLINSLDDLNALQGPHANYAGNYALGNDIDANYSFYTPQTVGIGNQGGYTFTGQFDGMGHTITDAYVYQGFFDTIGANGVVRNLNITDTAASSSFFGGGNGEAGLLVRDNQGLITNVDVSGNVDVSYGSFAGGLAGQNDGTIERAGSGASVGAEGTAGGLVGENNGHIVQSYATGNLYSSANTYADEIEGGALVGTNNGTISQSYATGNAAGTFVAGAAAGLVAFNNGTISQSFATGLVAGESPDPNYPAQLAGIANGGTIASDVYWNAQTTGQSYGGPGLSASNGLTTAQMSNPASFVGWNFGPSGVWAMPAGATHPVLAWQLATP